MAFYNPPPKTNSQSPCRRYLVSIAPLFTGSSFILFIVTYIEKSWCSISITMGLNRVYGVVVSGSQAMCKAKQPFCIWVPLFDVYRSTKMCWVHARALRCIITPDTMVLYSKYGLTFLTRAALHQQNAWLASKKSMWATKSQQIDSLLRFMNHVKNETFGQNNMAMVKHRKMCSWS